MYIEFKDVEKKIKGTTVIHDLNARFEGGKVYGLKGKNGCGKTMTLRLVCGLIKATKGTIDINGKILGKDISFPESIGALIENPSFLNDYTGLENLKMLASINSDITEEHIRDVIEKVGLDPDDKRKYRKYSLGMKQRLGIACAVMENPQIVILDEPINAIDENGIVQVRAILADLKELGSIIIVVCHDTEELEMLADEIYVMKDGMIVDKSMVEHN